MITRTNSLTARFLASAIALAAFLPGYANADEITVKHAQGETVLPDTPKTVLTFDFATLDTLDTLGVDVAGVPNALLPDYLSKYKSDDYVKVGSLFEPDFEVVNAARPDLIIVAGRSAKQYEALSRIAPTIDLTVAQDDFLNSAEDNARKLGVIFDREEKAEELIEKLNTSVAALRETAKDAGKGLIILTNGGKVSAYGPGSRFGWLHDDLGVIPAVENVQEATHGEAVSFEFLLKTNPDWLFVVDRDSAIGSEGQSAKQTLDNELVAATTAAKEGNIYYADSVRWYLVGGGMTALQAEVDALSKALTPVD